MLVSPALERAGVLVAFTERTGGHSSPPHRSLNLGFHTGDDPARVRRNRETVVADLGIPPFATARQVHGARWQTVGPERAGAGFADPSGAIAGTDALVVRAPRVPVAVLGADCVPILLAGPRAAVAVHAGWRGVAAGILERALAAAGGARAAAVGPAIGPCHYEVGPEVVAAVDRGTGGRAVTRQGGARPQLDLPATVATVLRDAGVRSVDLAGLCTACHEDRFFSHRRDGRTGRQAMVAMRL